MKYIKRFQHKTSICKKKNQKIVLELKNITEIKLNERAQCRMEGTEERISEL